MVKITTEHTHTLLDFLFFETPYVYAITLQYKRDLDLKVPY